MHRHVPRERAWPRRQFSPRESPPTLPALPSIAGSPSIDHTVARAAIHGPPALMTRKRLVCNRGTSKNVSCANGARVIDESDHNSRRSPTKLLSKLATLVKCTITSAAVNRTPRLVDPHRVARVNRPPTPYTSSYQSKARRSSTLTERPIVCDTSKAPLLSTTEVPAHDAQACLNNANVVCLR